MLAFRVRRPILAQLQIGEVVCRNIESFNFPYVATLWATKSLNLPQFDRFAKTSEVEQWSLILI
jgi:cytosine/uracil/thiamine/allantoin permease